MIPILSPRAYLRNIALGFVLVVSITSLALTLSYRPPSLVVSEQGGARFTLADLSGKVLSAKALDTSLTGIADGKTLVSTKTGLTRVGAQAQSASGGSSSGVRMPTTSGFNVDQFTGTSTISYPFTLPPARGGYSPGLSLSYSSRSIDELRLNVRGKSDFPDLAKCEGNCWEQRNKVPGDKISVGWSLGGIPKMHEDDGRNILALPSGRVEVVYDSADKTYKTVPDSKLLIQRLKDPDKWAENVPTGWIITDSSGTVYVFGGERELDSSHETSAWGGVGDDPGRTPFCSISQNAWNLTRVSDIHGNTTEYVYEQDRDGGEGQCNRTIQIRPLEIKYNWDDDTRTYLSHVLFSYTPSEGQDAVESTTKHLSALTVKNRDTILGRYDLGYTLSFKNNEWTGVDGSKSARRLLTSITRKGVNGAGSERPYTFCYKSLLALSNPEVCPGVDTSPEVATYTPNDIYLVRADNGYGGVISYTYEKQDKIDRICANREGWKDEDWDTRGQFQRICTDASGFMPSEWGRDFKTSFYRIARVQASNGVGQIKQTEYRYTGQSVAYAQDLNKFDGHYSPRIVGGLQFFGYPSVQTKVTDGSSGKILSFTEQRTLHTLESGPNPGGDRDINGSCFMPHPQKGMVHESLVLNESGSPIGKSESSFLVRPALTCLPKRGDWGRFEVFQKQQQSEIDGKKSKSETIYDFEVYPGDVNRNHGNPVKTIDYGNPDIIGDETYSYTTYIQDEWPAGYLQYLSKNIRSLVTETFTSDQNHRIPQDVPEQKRLNWARTSYDERVADWGYQEGVSGVRALVSKQEQIIMGQSADEPTKKFSVTSTIDYNKYGLPVKQTSPHGIPSSTFYDGAYHMLPFCSVQWKIQTPTSLDPAVACDRGRDADKKFVTSSNFATAQSTDRALPDESINPSSAITRMEYDEYGRTRKVYAPDQTSGLPESTPTQETLYYDNEVPLRTRVKNRIVTQSETTYTYGDTIVDGFGNTLQTVTYGLKDSEGPYALLSTQSFNGIGQVEESVEGAPLRGVALPPSPQLIAKDTIIPLKRLAVVTTTQYDFFSRPVSTTKLIGGPSTGEMRTTRTRYDGYKTYVTGSDGNEAMTEVRGKTQIATRALCPHATGCTLSAGTRLTIETDADILGNTLRVRDERGITVSETTYNSVGAPLLVRDLDRGVTKIYYDALGRLQKAVDARGVVSETVTYDTLNRATHTRVSLAGKSDEVKTTYDTILPGKVTRTEFTSSGQYFASQSYQYTKHGEVRESQTTHDPSRLGIREPQLTVIESHTVSASGLPLTSSASLNGTVVDTSSYEYDDAGNTRAILMDTRPLITSLVRNYRGNVLSHTEANTIRIQSTFDNLARPLTRDISRNGASLFNELFTYQPQTSYLARLETRYQNGVSDSGSKPAIAPPSATPPRVSPTRATSPTRTPTRAPTRVLIPTRTPTKRPGAIQRPTKAPTSKPKYSPTPPKKLIPTSTPRKGSTPIPVKKISPTRTPARSDKRRVNIPVNPRAETGMQPMAAIGALPVNQKPKTGEIVLPSQDEGEKLPSTGSTRASDIQSFTFDSWGRLKSVQGTEYQGTYQFDIVGNIEIRSETGQKGQVLPDTSNSFFTPRFTRENLSPCKDDAEYVKFTGYRQDAHGCPYHALRSSTHNRVTTFYLYDTKGNLIAEYEIVGQGTGFTSFKRVEYQFGTLDLPVKITQYNAQGVKTSEETYVYGPGGARVAKVTDMNNYSLYLGRYEKTKKGSSLTEVVMTSASPHVAKVRTNGGAWDARYTYSNYQGSTAFILNAQGSYLPEFAEGRGTLRYSAYGTQLNTLDITRLHRENTYTGQKKDTTTGLMYYNARYYNPTTGVFIQADSVNDGLNRYAYVSGNPIMNTDSTGNKMQTDCAECGSTNPLEPPTEQEIRDFMIRVGPMLGTKDGGILNKKIMRISESVLNNFPIKHYTNLIFSGSGNSSYNSLGHTISINHDKKTYLSSNEPAKTFNSKQGESPDYIHKSLEWTLAHEMGHELGTIGGKELNLGINLYDSFEQEMSKYGIKWHNRPLLIDEEREFNPNNPIDKHHLLNSPVDSHMFINNYDQVTYIEGFSKLLTGYARSTREEAFAEYTAFYFLQPKGTVKEKYGDAPFPLEFFNRIDKR